MTWNIFSCSVGWYFNLLNVSFDARDFKILMHSHLSIFVFTAYVFEIILKKQSQIQCNEVVPLPNIFF